MLWRAAPARLLRAPAWAVVVLAAATLLVASTVAPRLFASTARATALADGLEAVAGAPYGADSGDLRVTWDAVLPPTSEELLLARLRDLPGYGEPRVTAAAVGQSRTTKAVVAVGGRQEPSALWTREGAVAALGGDPDAPGVWLAADVADRLGLPVGDRLRIGLQQTFLATGGALRRTVLAGTYETAPGSALPAALADDPDAARWLLPADPDDLTATTPLAVVGRATFDRLVLSTRDRPLYLADLALDPDVTPDEASAAVVDLQDLGDDAYDGSQPLARALGQGEPIGASLQVLTGLPDLAFEADYTAGSAADQVRPYAVAGQLLAAALLVVAWVLLMRSRRREQLLAAGLGLRPGEVAALTALEALPVLLVAFPAGVGLACLGVLVAGPPAPGVVIDATDVGRGVAGAAVALLLVAVAAGTGAVATERLDRASRLGRGRRAVPWTPLLLVATAAVAAAVLTVEPADRSRTALVMLFPVLVAGSVAVLVARAAAWARGRRLGRARPGSPRWLATRRTGPVVREVTALTALVAVTLGLVAYALTVHRGIEQGVADKTAALAGARTTMAVADDFRGHRMAGAVTPPAPRTTIVWRRTASLPPDFGGQPLLAIDPDSFDAVADWGASGDLEPGRAALPLLAEPARGLPVVVAGDTDLAVGDHGTLDFSEEFQVPFEVVAVVAAFPGSESEPGNVTVVASTRRLFRLLPPTVDPRRRGADAGDAGAFASWVWSSESTAGLRDALTAAGVSTDGAVETATEARVSGGLVGASWAAAYVLALGCVLLVLALGGVLVLSVRLADRDAVSDVLLARMGWRGSELARARTWEVGYAVGAALLAAVLAGGVLVLGPSVVDAAVAVPPLSRPRPSATDVAVLVAALAAAVLLAWLLGVRRAGRRRPAEVLRGGA